MRTLKHKFIGYPINIFMRGKKRMIWLNIKIGLHVSSEQPGTFFPNIFITYFDPMYLVLYFTYARAHVIIAYTVILRAKYKSSKISKNKTPH